MKSLATLLNKTPWWVLLLGGLATLMALALLVTPFQLMRLERAGATPEENRAIKREVEFAFSEGAVDVVRRVVREMRAHARDPELRAELDAALADIEEARANLRDASREAKRARQEAAQSMKEAVRDASRAIAQAQKQTERALKDAGPEGDRIRQALDESLKSAREAEQEATRAQSESAELPPFEGAKAAPVPEEAAPEPAKPAPEAEADKPAPKRRITVKGGRPDRPMFRFEIDPAGKDLPALTPEVRADIRRKVSSDLRQIGVGAGLILIFIPLFILTIVAKFFIDRSRAAQRAAEHEHREAQLQRMSRQVTEAKLAALQAQVEPHFLYNTLASVQALTEVDPRQANAMTGHLIQYLRNALPKMRESVSTVGQEIELVRAYLSILQMRMGKRLAFEIVLPPELAEAPFPPLMLPSLVENAVRHGLEPLREGGRVTIMAEARDGRIRISVADTGRGFGESVGSGVGLDNIRERLAALYGGAGKLVLEANTPQGVIATLEVPRQAPAAAGGPTGAPPSAQAPAAPRSAAAKTLAYMGSAERAWRKGLSFAFVALVVVAAVFAGLAVVGVTTGLLPVQFGDASIGGAMGALIGTAAIAVAFLVVVLAIAIVLALIYGLGFLMAGIAIFVPLVVLVSLVPALAPLILVGLVIWWFVRRRKRKDAEAKAAAP